MLGLDTESGVRDFHAHCQRTTPARMPRLQKEKPAREKQQQQRQRQSGAVRKIPVFDECNPKDHAESERQPQKARAERERERGHFSVNGTTRLLSLSSAEVLAWVERGSRPREREKASDEVVVMQDVCQSCASEYFPLFSWCLQKRARVRRPSYRVSECISCLQINCGITEKSENWIVLPAPYENPRLLCTFLAAFQNIIAENGVLCLSIGA